MIRTILGPMAPKRIYPAMLVPIEAFDTHAATQHLSFSIPKSHFWMGLIMGLVFGITGPAAAVFVTNIMTTPAGAWLNWESAGALAVVWVVALMSLAIGYLMISTEFDNLGFRRTVHFTETGVDAVEIDRYGRVTWTAPFTSYLGVVLAVTHGEAESTNTEVIELRHFDPAKTLSLHRGQGSGLHPEIRRKTRDIAARLDLQPYVEINKVLVPITS